MSLFDINNMIVFSLPTAPYSRVEVEKKGEDTAAHPDFLSHSLPGCPSFLPNHRPGRRAVWSVERGMPGLEGVK